MPALGLATCPYRAAPGRSFWSVLEAVGLNTEFIAGVLVARMMEGMKFALGPTIAARRETLERIGGFDGVKDYLAEDFVMGKLAAETGYKVILSSYVIEHRIGSQPFRANMRHRLRWNRSTRRSRPWGYAGQVFTNPLPLALILWAVAPGWWPMVAAAVALRAAVAWAMAAVLGDELARRRWYLVPRPGRGELPCLDCGILRQYHPLAWPALPRTAGWAVRARQKSGRVMNKWTGSRNCANAVQRPLRVVARSGASGSTARASFPRASA